jgi:hypothetical protein
VYQNELPAFFDNIQNAITELCVKLDINEVGVSIFKKGEIGKIL